jgi:hypothetical protein
MALVPFRIKINSGKVIIVLDGPENARMMKEFLNTEPTPIPSETKGKRVITSTLWRDVVKKVAEFPD